MLAVGNGATSTDSAFNAAASSNVQTPRIIQCNNVGNRATIGVILTDSRLWRKDHNYPFAPDESAAECGFIWSIYCSDQIVFAQRLDSNQPQTGVGQTPIETTMPPRGSR